jgi:pSer/pThr/pTyr-binding forkhead associated (FHA) protein
MAVLIGMSQEVKGKSVEIREDQISIGRKADNTIPVDNPTVSGHHCLVLREENRYVVRDLRSTNGTRVNNKEVKDDDVVIKPKDIIQVGSIEFMFDAAQGEVPTDEPVKTTDVEVAPGPATAPESFGNISPFGARRSESKGMWFLVIAALGLLALGAVVYFFYKLITET